jgi:hypothetical protein
VKRNPARTARSRIRRRSAAGLTLSALAAGTDAAAGAGTKGTSWLQEAPFGGSASVWTYATT